LPLLSVKAPARRSVPLRGPNGAFLPPVSGGAGEGDAGDRGHEFQNGTGPRGGAPLGKTKGRLAA